jgi:iron complex outermembrane receptor protein
MTQLRGPRATVLAGVAVLSLGAARSAAAQATPDKSPVPIPAVQVVATRSPEAPHDVPASIEVISGVDLRARGVSTFREALALATGISVAPGGDMGPASAVPEIWGLREFDAFLLVVDGIPMGGAFNPAITALSLRDVERIEVLRGPAPVTFGATSFVGVIHVVHTAASATSRYLTLEGGSYGSGSAAIDAGVPLIGNWKSRLSADFTKQGFKDDRTSFQRGHALWRASAIEGAAKTWFTAELNVLRQDPASPHVREGTALSTNNPLDANYNPAGAFLNTDRLSLSAGIERPAFNGATWGTTASFARSQQRIFRGFITDLSTTPNNASGFKENIDINDLYVDSHLIWPAISNVKYMVGADLLYGSGDAEGAAFNYTVPVSGAIATAVASPAFNLDAKDRRTFLGAYASAEWRPDPRFTLSAGVRLNATSEKRGDANDVTNTRLSGSVGAIYSLWEQGTDHVRLFANYRDTFKPAAYDFGLGDDENVLKPETSHSYEGGFKIRTMEGRLDFEASAFQMDFSNLVASALVNNLPALINSGKTRFKGFELAADYRIADDLSARASYSAHDSKFVDFLNDFGDGTLTQLGGKRLEMTAKSLYSAGLAYAPAEGFIASAGVNYTGERYLNKRNTALAPAFSVFDAGIGYRTGRYEVRVDGKNLGNARDAMAESEIGDAQYYRMTATSVQLGVVIKY